jgi:hypothetical protein
MSKDQGQIPIGRNFKGAIGIRWTHECVGVLAHIPDSLLTELLGRIEVHACA